MAFPALAKDVYLPLLFFEQAEDQLERCRLPGAVGSEETIDAVPGDAKVDGLQDRCPGVPMMGEVGCFEAIV